MFKLLVLLAFFPVLTSGVYADYTNRNFIAPHRERVGELLVDSASADFNGDGKMDTAVLDEYSAKVWVMLGDGNGNLTLSNGYEVGQTPQDIKAVKLNNDAFVDLAIANNSQTYVTIYYGNGDGTFGGRLDVEIGLPSAAISVQDLNGDRRPDLAVAAADMVKILFGNAAGGFDLQDNVPTGEGPHDIVSGNFDRRRGLDLAVVNADDNTLTILFNDGAGHFYRQNEYPAGNAPVALAGADLNGDGRDDLAVVNRDSDSVTVFTGGFFSDYFTTATLSVGDSPRAITASDLNRDSRPDLAVLSHNGKDVSVFFGNGNSAFSSPVSWYVGPEPVAGEAKDFNNDGWPDLSVVNQSSRTISVVLNDRSGGLDAVTNFELEHNVVSLVKGDLNGDGHTDIAAITDQADHRGLLALDPEHESTSTILVLFGDGKGGYEAGGDYEAGTHVTEGVIADFDGDTHPDIAVSELGHNRILLFINNGVGTFPPEPAEPIRIPVGTGPNSIATADFNGDDLPDLVTADRAANQVSVALNDKKELFSAPAASFAVGQRPLSVALGDFNGDTFVDIATANLNSADVSILIGHGDGTFDPALHINGGATPSYLVSSDVNDDGDLDLIVANGTVTARSIAVLLGNGSGGFALAHDIPVGKIPVSVTVGEFNNDGNADLAVVDPDLSSVLVLHGDGSGNFSFTRNYGVGLSPSKVITEDFDGDGKNDLLCANFGANSISLLRNAWEPAKRAEGILMVQSLKVPVGDKDNSPGLVSGTRTPPWVKDLVTLRP
jgi:hypothetical protein